MSSARLIDASSVTVLGLCPACPHREFGYEEVPVRRGLLAHIETSHTSEVSKRSRDSLRKWLKRYERQPA
jgi:hypothetical protein